MKKALKILRKVCFWIFFIGLFLVTTITVILYVYEDEIKQYAVDELNEHLTTPVEVEDIELTFFHSFPSASIEFKKVFIADAFPLAKSDDTLFHAESMFFNFNVMDIYSGNYTVKRISIHEGGLHLKTMADGQSNYNILKPDEDKEDSEDKFEFLLELLELEDIDFKYKNLASQQFYDLNIGSALLQGNFTDNEYNLVSEADLYVNRLKSNSFTLVKDKAATLDLELGVNSLAQSYTFNKGDLMIEKMPFHITGMVDSSSIDLNLSGNDIELHDLANSLVDESLQDVKIYEGTGIVNFVSHIHGPISATEMPSIEAQFDINGGTITEPESDITITDVAFQGEYRNAQIDRQEELLLKDVSMNMLNSHFSGNASIVDFAQPILTTSMAGNLNLARFHQFFNFSNVEKLAGNVNFNLNAKVQFFDPEYSKEKFEVLASDGVFHLDQVQYKAVGDPLLYKSVSGELVLNNKDAAANQLVIHTRNSDLTLNGAMKNLMPFLEGSGNLGLIASIESNYFDLNEFLPKSQGDSDGPLEVFELPSNMNLNVDLDVKNFKWDGHKFQNVGAKMLMANREVKMNNLHMNMLEGTVRGDLLFKNLLEQGNVIDGQLSFNNVNINTLFKEWDNFDQKSITDKHLSGKTSGTIDLLLAFNPYFSLIEEKLFAKCNFKVVNGELNNLETMKSITDYMRSNIALKLMLNKHIDKFEDKLLRLKFSDIENEITIQNRKITIPKMKIRTNALDIELFGWHDFDNQIEYHLSFRFRELKEQVVENEFGIIEDDGLGLVIYLTMTGDLDDPDYSMDGNERREQFKQHLKDDKKDIKSMLKTDLGFFKKDSTVQKIERTNRNEVQFIIYDGEQEEPKDTVVTEEKKNKKHTLKLFEKWKKEAKDGKGKIEYQEEK